MKKKIGSRSLISKPSFWCKDTQCKPTNVGVALKGIREVFPPPNCNQIKKLSAPSCLVDDKVGNLLSVDIYLPKLLS